MFKLVLVVLAFVAIAQCANTKAKPLDVSLYRSHKHYANFTEKRLTEIKEYSCNVLC